MKTCNGLVVILLFSLCDGKTACRRKTTCRACAETRMWFGPSCRWCPLSRACHEYGSLYNPCFSNQYITDPDRCYDQAQGVFNVETAYMSIFLAAISYSEAQQECLDEILPQSNVEILEFIKGKCEDLSTVPYTECFAYTAINHVSNTIILTFRGVYTTEQLFDFYFSSVLTPMEPFLIGGKVLGYLRDTFDRMYPCYEESVMELIENYPEYEVLVTGDSFGSTLATLAASALIYNDVVPGDKLFLYTTGSPRVGNKDYAISHDRLVKNSWRIVNYVDSTPQTPPCAPLGCTLSQDTLYHVGTEIFFPERAMTIDSPYKQCRGNEDMDCSRGLVTTADLQTRVFYHRVYFNVTIAIGDLCKEYRNRTVSTDDEECRRVDAKTLRIKNSRERK